MPVHWKLNKYALKAIPFSLKTFWVKHVTNANPQLYYNPKQLQQNLFHYIPKSTIIVIRKLNQSLTPNATQYPLWNH